MAIPKVAAPAFPAQPPSGFIRASGTFKRRELDLRRASYSLLGGTLPEIHQLHCEKPQIPVSAAFMKKANFRPWWSGPVKRRCTSS